MKYIILGIFIILMFFTLQKHKPNVTSLSPQDTILAFGDSLTYGQGAKKNESYPSMLSSLTKQKVINAGINGETSEDGFKRLPKLLEDKSIQLLILCFGGNDILRRQSMKALKNNLKMIIRMAKEKEIEVLLVAVPNIGLFGLSPLELYEEVAEEEEVILLSGVLSDILEDPALKSDQIHPNALGYKKMAEKIYNTLQTNGWVD